MTETVHAIIGTAGHIDHGKTALVRALTGCDTDRLKEEMERGISIDLGFAALIVDEKRVGIIDVPGHERFIRNMLAGAHGLDLVLLTVAADDGVMPQTEEHLDVLHLLGVEHGVVVVTKSDLVDADRLADVRRDVEQLLAGTRLAGAPIVPVSSTTGSGLDTLLEEIARQLRSIVRPPPPGPFRLPVDRAFVLKGHGVVVTGTAVAGTIAAGAEVRILPGGERARVRSVEVHGTPVAVAGWRQRVALNLAGADHARIARGSVIVDPALTLTTDRLDVQVEIRPAAGRGLASHARVRVYLGTAEAMGKIVLLEQATLLAPTQRSFAQLVLERPLVALRGDRFVLRAENAVATIGGGEVVVPIAERHRRGHADLIRLLAIVRSGDLGDAVVAALELAPEWGVSPSILAQRLNVGEADLPAPAGIVALMGGTSSETWTTVAKWTRIREQIAAFVGRFHAANALLPGIDVEVLRTRLHGEVEPKLFRSIVERLVAEGSIVRRDRLLAMPSHGVALTGARADLAGRVKDVLSRSGYTPPDVDTLAAELHVDRPRLADVIGVLEGLGEVVRVLPGLYYPPAAVDRARTRLQDALHARSEITAAEFRDLLGVSRKFSIALLDYFDRTGVTLRIGDRRKLRRG